MNADIIIQRAEAKPFRVFALRTMDGKEYVVTDRRRIGWTRTKKLFVYSNDEGHFDMIDVDSIVTLLSLTPEATT